MLVQIHSRESIGRLIEEGFPENTAVISFYSPIPGKKNMDAPVDYCGRPARLFYIRARDVDIETLPSLGLTYETYMPEADEAARFIVDAVRDGMQLICQCDYGQSRSAACCAAILEHFERRGIEIFADYRYYPNQVVFNKILEALRKAGPQTCTK